MNKDQAIAFLREIQTASTAVIKNDQYNKEFQEAIDVLYCASSPVEKVQEKRDLSNQMDERYVELRDLIRGKIYHEYDVGDLRKISNHASQLALTANIFIGLLRGEQ